MRLIKCCLLTTIIVTVLASSTKAQGKDVPFHKGSKTVGLFLGSGVHYAYYENPSTPVTFGVTYDQGFFDEVGPGNIGIGGVIAFKGSTGGGSYGPAKYRSFIVAGRGTYHLTLLADKNNKFDPYGGITIGLSFNDGSYDNEYYDNIDQVTTVVGLFVGAKYNFSEKIGAFAEVGFDITNIRGGIAFNF